MLLFDKIPQMGSFADGASCPGTVIPTVWSRNFVVLASSSKVLTVNAYGRAALFLGTRCVFLPTRIEREGRL
jgi:hypothetical protein